jgi:hypothetical protein
MAARHFFSALAGGESYWRDFGEGQVLGRAVRALFPVEEELAVAVSEAGGVVNVERGQSLINPLGGALEFGVVADRGLIDDEMRGGLRVGAGGVGPLGAVLLVDEGRSVAELKKDLGQRRAFGYGGFGLDADLVASGVDGVLLVGLAFVGDGAEAAVLADAEDLAEGAEVAVGSVVEGVVLEGAGSVEMEAEGGKAGLEIDDVGYGDL